MQAKPRAKLRQPKSDQQSNSLPEANFIEQLSFATKNPSWKHGKIEENSSLGTGGSRIGPASREATKTREKLFLDHFHRCSEPENRRKRNRGK
jgi:hypothetical protein